MDCKQFKSNFEPAEDYRDEFLEHTQSCEDCRLFAQEETALTGLLSGLARTESPVGFVSSVKTKIAAKRRPSRLVGVAAKFLLPAAATLIFAFLVWNSNLFSPPAADKSNATAAKINNQGDKTPTAADTEMIRENISAESNVAVPIEKVSVTENNKSEKEIRNKSAEPRELAVKESKTETPIATSPRLNSRDMGFEEPEFTNPPGIDPDKVVTASPQPNEKPFSSTEVLATLGIVSEWQNGRLVVTSVVGNSVGEQAGVKSGDQIRSIDGKKITKDPVSSGSVKGGVIKVVRNGKMVTLNIGRNR